MAGFRTIALCAEKLLAAEEEERAPCVLDRSSEPREELQFVSVIKAKNERGEGGSRRISMDTKRGRE